MNKSIIRQVVLLFLLSPFMVSFAQSFEGSYKYNNDSIMFSNDKVIFNLSDFGALSSQIVGEGTYQYTDRYLIIDTKEYSGNKSSLKKQPSSTTDTINIVINGIDGYAFSGVLVEFLSKSNKVLDRKVTNDYGKVEYINNDKIKGIRVSHMGYNNLETDIDNNTDISVILAKNNVIQNQTVVIELIEDDEQSIQVRLLSDKFIPGKNIDKDLEKLLKKANKANILSKRLKKEYVSVFYNK